MGRDIGFRALGGGKRHIEPVVLIDSARARLHIERGEAWMILVVVMHAADMEGVARILPLQIGAPLAVGGKGKIEPSGRKPAP